MKGKKEEVKKNRAQFRAWKPLEVYVSHSLIKEGVFSIRCLGQEVAKLNILDGKKTLIVEEKHLKHNMKYFGFERLRPGKYGWEEAGGFRKHFKNLLYTDNKTKTGIEEHKLEWMFLREMSRKSIKDKFSGKLAYIQPVKMAGCPLQMPLPLGGSGGEPQKGDGHIDILARRRRKEDGKVVLSLWELKDVGKLAEAVKQVYIYATTMLFMLRSPSGKQWYKIFGFNGAPPEKLEVEGVVAVSKDQKSKLLGAAKKATADMPLNVKEGQVRLYACFYEPPHVDETPTSLRIESFQELPF